VVDFLERFYLCQPDLYRGDSTVLTGCVREDFLANNLDRKARNAGPSNRPEATKHATRRPSKSQTADSAVRRFFEIKSHLRLFRGEGKRPRNTMETSPITQISSDFIVPLSQAVRTYLEQIAEWTNAAIFVDKGNMQKVA
jgi:hypothetical protein